MAPHRPQPGIKNKIKQMYAVKRRISAYHGTKIVEHGRPPARWLIEAQRAEQRSSKSRRTCGPLIVTANRRPASGA
jgi:hypothetical protein